MTKDIQLAENLELVNSYKKLAKDYGLFADKVLVPQPGADSKEYLVFSLSPIQSDVNPVSIINRNKRNTNIFYPENFAVELHKDNPLLIWERISNYLAYAEFMYEIYDQFHTPLPKAIRVDELEALANFYYKMTNPAFDEATRLDYMEGLKEFFKNEKPKTKFMKEWQEFYRSELFDTSKPFLQNFFSFLKRHEPETSLNALVESTDDLKKIYMAEHHYKEFREIIKERHPGVKYSVSEKRVVDKGMVVDPETKQPVETPYGITVSKEEYDRVREERFAEEGHACLDGITPSYFEGRDIIYKASDENIIASVGHEIAYRWAKCSSMEELGNSKNLNSVDIPVGHMMNFYAEMTARGIPFHLDFDVNNQPNFETLKIVYHVRDDATVKNILVGLAMAQLNTAHLFFTERDVMLDIDVEKVDALIQHARARALASPAEQGLLDENTGIKADDCFSVEK